MATSRAVVIGSGAGGLAAAAYLAKAGCEVVTLEQGPHLGGYLAPFQIDGYQFNPGIYTVGKCRPGQLVFELLAGAGVDPSRLFAEQDPDGFDVFRFPGFEVRRCRGSEKYLDRLTRLFPSDAAGLRRLFEMAEAYGRNTEALTALRTGQLRASQVGKVFRMFSALRWATRPYAELLEDTLEDPRARAVMGAITAEFGLPPSRAATLGAMLRVAHFGDGAFFPRGGSARLVDALVTAAQKHGARFRTNARVRRILTEGQRAVGVELDGGERIAADVVVSDADPVLTLGELVAPEVLPAGLHRKLRRTEPSYGTFSLYLGMRRDLRAHGMGSFTVFDCGTWDLEAAYPRPGADRLPETPVLFLSPNSLKDDTASLAPAGCSTLQVFTFAPWSMFSRWSELGPGQRGNDYQREKLRLTEQVLSVLDARWPGLVGDVEVTEVSTPLTNQAYTFAVHGGGFGPAMTPRQSGFRQFRPTTPVPNLLLAGAGVLGSGFAACLSSGRVAARIAEQRLVH